MPKTLKNSVPVKIQNAKDDKLSTKDREREIRDLIAKKTASENADDKKRIRRRLRRLAGGAGKWQAYAK